MGCANSHCPHCNFHIGFNNVIFLLLGKKRFFCSHCRGAFKTGHDALPRWVSAFTSLPLFNSLLPGHIFIPATILCIVTFIVFHFYVQWHFRPLLSDMT